MEAAPAPAPDSGLELGGNTPASISTRWGVLATTGPTTLSHSDRDNIVAPYILQFVRKKSGFVFFVVKNIEMIVI